MTPKWYLRRLGSMSTREVADRGADAIRRRRWRVRPPPPPVVLPSWAGPVVPDGLTASVGVDARAALLAEADGLLAGRWTMFGRSRTDMTADLDYFRDFVSGTRAPDDRYALAIDHRDEASVGNVKFVWEPARHHHLTVLAGAFALSGAESYAQRVDAELRHYWRTNPFLRGIHWTSGIELGIRLISWTWIRRLLDGWSGVAALFEDNPTFVDQLGRHQQWLAAFGSHGSSANNHVIAEAAGRFVAASAFPAFARSGAWRDEGAERLVRELQAQTFADGLNRELASDYHGFVLELALAGWVEAVLVGHPAAEALIEPIGRAVDALHAVVDQTGRPHRQGDSDDANGWLVDPIGYDRWASLLASAALVVEPASWWAGQGPEPVPPGPGDVRTAVIARCVAGRHRPARPPARPRRRPGLFADAGLSLLRTDPSADGNDELWCMFDHGPLGYLSTAAHGHADALAIEVRCGGVEIIVDPGTYCYHGEPRWRNHFRSTAAHATLVVADADQSEMRGPFLWGRRANARLEADEGLAGDGPRARSVAHHDGYRRLGWIHRRAVELDRVARTLVISDRLEAIGPQTQVPVPVTLNFPLGPGVDVELDRAGARAGLSWSRWEGCGRAEAVMALDPAPHWEVHRGRHRPPTGWYSPSFGHKVPSAMLVGRSLVEGTAAGFTTTITFLPGAAVPGG